MKMVMGILLGAVLMLILGADNLSNVRVSGHVWTWHEMYQSTFSGITSDGDCYLALTNSLTGRTEIFKITKKLGEGCDETAFQKGAGRIVTHPNVVRTYQPPQEQYSK
jgi:hypothetical protein